MSARRIRELSDDLGNIETALNAYAIVAADMDESEVVAHVMIQSRRAELEILLGRTHRELSAVRNAQHEARRPGGPRRRK